jgi:ribulose-5-phosphate 4-epimerase/fuculose-1-phosphate aldolase
MNETGVIKFHYEASGSELVTFPCFAELNAARQELRKLGLIGVDKHAVGFGNVSMRDDRTNSFYITGSATGALAALSSQNYARVVAWDFDRNWLRYEGRALPSAESLTHAVIYELAAEVRVVVHGHDANLWRTLLERGSATGVDIPYGTPAMAREVQRLFRETDVGVTKIFAMAGHCDGIVAFGQSFRETLNTLVMLRTEVGSPASA